MSAVGGALEPDLQVPWVGAIPLRSEVNSLSNVTTYLLIASLCRYASSLQLLERSASYLLHKVQLTGCLTWMHCGCLCSLAQALSQRKHATLVNRVGKRICEGFLSLSWAFFFILGEWTLKVQPTCCNKWKTAIFFYYLNKLQCIVTQPSMAILLVFSMVIVFGRHQNFVTLSSNQ